MEEQLDILNERAEKTGQSRSYNEAHRDGLMHRSVHIWFLNSQGQILFQKRKKDRIAYPSYWDISVSGHISAGQTSIEAAQMETEEEIGLTLPAEAYIYLFTVEQHIALNNRTHVDNEFQDVFVVYSDIDISKLKLSEEEVEEVRWIDIGEFERWVKEKEETLVPHEEEYKKLLEYLKASK